MESKTPLCQSIWDETITKDHPSENQSNYWPLVYKICFKCIQDNNLSWFQYRIMFKILGTKEYLKKVKISETSDCGLCKQSAESIVYLFHECDQANIYIYI